MINSIFEILVDEDGRSLFQIQDNEYQFIGNNELSGVVKEDIPIVLPTKKKELNSEMHQSQNSDFDYINHYQKDAEVFDYSADYESAVTREEIRRLHQSIIRQIPKKSQLILDVGCGGGWLSKTIDLSNNQLISMDISYGNPKNALDKTPHENHFGLVADVFHLPIKKNSIDVIVASEIMEHVGDPKLFIANLFSLLKPGGSLIITTPYNEKIAMHLCIHCNRQTPENAHLHSFNEENVKALIPDSANYTFHKFGNNIFTKLRLYLIMKVLPYSIWRLKDKVINSLLGKPTRMMLIINK